MQTSLLMVFVRNPQLGTVKTRLAVTVGDKIGRQRRFNSCQLDYKSAENLINRRINVEEDENEVRIFLPLPPTTF